MDLYGDPEKRDEINPFVRLLWEKGNAFEEQTAEKFESCVADFTNHTAGEKEISTLAAIERRESLIYGGRIRADDLLGDDLDGQRQRARALRQRAVAKTLAPQICAAWRA